ncbi:MAG: Mur ligase family protein [Mariprofundaceae bacterium]|nr:Mur ligase family protein [Mariprofundaceae bacterium]
MHKPSSVEAWLEQLHMPTADRDYQPGHARMHRLLQAIHPQRPGLRIRIAGTNGKGSTAFMLAHALQAAGLKVGLYTSPHLRRFHERIRIDGLPADDATLRAGLAQIMPLALEIGASYFEVATALALLVFSREEVDVEVLEAGVGARLDATTAVDADMALITPIALDHQDWLGDCIEEIAREKAHVMDGCRWAIAAPQPDAVMRVLRRYRPGLQLAEADDELPPLAAKGEHQRVNAALARAGAMKLLAEKVIIADPSLLTQAIAGTAIPGRLQHVCWHGCDVWLDAAHNPHAVEALLPSLPDLADPFDAIMVFTREDRDLSTATAWLRPLARRLVGGQGGLDAHYPDVATALEAERNIRPKGRFLLLGSFTTVAAAWQYMEGMS